MSALAKHKLQAALIFAHIPPGGDKGYHDFTMWFLHKGFESEKVKKKDF